MVIPVEFVFHGNPQNVDGGGLSDGNTIECQGAVVQVFLIDDGHCLSFVLEHSNPLFPDSDPLL